MDQFYLGVDVARLGADQSVFEVISIGNDGVLRQVENITTTKTLLTATTNAIISLNRKYNFRKIYIDTGGLGVGVFDSLLEEAETRRKVVDMDNAKRNLDYTGETKRKSNKEVMYVNLLRIMEQKKVQLLDDHEVKFSLRCIQYEHTDRGMRIYGEYSHITEGLIRACWSIKDKGLNIFATYV